MKQSLFKKSISRCFKPKSRSDGNILLIAMLGLAAVGVFGYMGTSYFSNLSNQQSQTQQDSERLILASMIRSEIDCDETLGTTIPMTCASLPGYIPLRMRNSGTFVAGGTGNATKFGNWAVRASCDSTNAELRIEAAYSTSAVGLTAANNWTGFMNDKFSGKKLGWGHPKGRIYPAGSGLCRANFQNLTPGFCPAPGVVRAARCSGTEAVREYDRNTTRLCCVSDLHGPIVSVDGDLRAQNPNCTSANYIYSAAWPYSEASAWGTHCVAAANRYCNAVGFWSGQIITGGAGPTVLVYCRIRMY